MLVLLPPFKMTWVSCLYHIQGLCRWYFHLKILSNANVFELKQSVIMQLFSSKYKTFGKTAFSLNFKDNRGIQGELLPTISSYVSCIYICTGGGFWNCFRLDKKKKKRSSHSKSAMRKNVFILRSTPRKWRSSAWWAFHALLQERDRNHFGTEEIVYLWLPLVEPSPWL